MPQIETAKALFLSPSSPQKVDRKWRKIEKKSRCKFQKMSGCRHFPGKITLDEKPIPP
jgi:hypothetical protein